MANPDRSVYDPPFDDDLMFDAVEEQETARGRPLMILLGIVVALAFAGVVWVAYQQGFQHAESGSAPLLSPEAGPTRISTTQPAATVPDNPIYEAVNGNSAPAAAPAEIPAPAAEEPVALPPAAPSLSEQPPSAAAAEPAPDMTVTELPAPPPVASPSVSAAPIVPSTRPPSATTAVDPLASDGLLPPPPALEEPLIATAPAGPDPDLAAAAKAEKERLAREAAAKKAEAARAAEIKRQQLAAAQPPAAPIAPAEIAPPAAASADPADEAYSPAGPSLTEPSPRQDASGRPTLLTPPTNELPPPAASRPAAIAAAPPSTSDIVPDAPAAASAADGGSFVVQIGAFNTAEEAAASWKRVQQSRGAALAGASPEIRQVEVRGTTKYRLRATGYADRAGAARACDRLKSGGLDCFVASR